MNKLGAIFYMVVSVAMITGFPIIIWQELKQVLAKRRKVK